MIQGRIDSPRDQDSFRVVMAQPGPVAVAVIPLTEGLKPFMKDSWDVPDSHGDTQNTTGTGSGDRVLDIVDSAVTFVDINVTSDESNSLTPIGDYVIWVWQPVGVTPTNKDNDPDTAGIESTSLLLDGSGNGSLPGYPNGTGQPALNSPGDKDVFRVEAAAARPITFTVTGQDTFLRIYDASAKAIATDHGSGTGGASQVTVEAERGQLFYIEVSAFNGTDQGPYTVNVSQPTDDYPDAPTYPPTASQPAITTIEGFTATIVTATGLDEPVGLAVAPSAFGSYAGDLFVANRQTKSPSDPDFITRIDITNGQNLGVSSRFVDVGPSDPHGVTFDASGTSLFVNTNSNTARDGRGRVLTISPSGDVSVYSNVGADSPGGALQFDDSGAYGGDLYIGVTGYSDFIGRIEGPGANASVFADFGSPPVDSISSPVDIAFGHGGAFGTAMYVTLAVVDANAIAPGIYRVQSDGSTERFVTSRETGLFASNPSGLALSEGGPFGEYMYVGRGNNVIRVAGDGTASVFATGFSGVTDVAFSNDGVVL